MNIRLLFLSSLAFATTAWAGPFYIRTTGPEGEIPPRGFLIYLNDGNNPNRDVNVFGNPNKIGPYNFGMVDGKYYPYSTPVGRRIGFCLPVPTATEAADYANGITTTEADQRLTAAVNGAAAALNTYLGQSVWEGLDINCQEMLVDFAISQGLSADGSFDLSKIPTAFLNTVLSNPTLTAVRAPLAATVCYERRFDGGLLNILKNRQFAYRFMGTYHH